VTKAGHPHFSDPCHGFLPGGQFVVQPTGTGTLDGLRFAVKDLINIAGYRTGGGNPDWLAASRPAERHAIIVSQLLNAGGQLIGKTVTDELAFSLEGVNAHYGTPVNPRNSAWLPGGSSSGSAVVTAAGLVDFAVGTDTGGSVRVPAAFCGIFGFRPSHGALRMQGVLPFAPGYDTPGWFSRDAQTLRAVGHALFPAGKVRPITRIRLVEDGLDHVALDVARDIRHGAAAITTHAPVRLFENMSLDLFQQVYAVVQGFEIGQALGERIATIRPKFDASIEQRFAGALTLREDDYRAACETRRTIAAHIAALCPPDTALILPVVSQRHLNTNADPDLIAAFYAKTLGLTAVAGHAGAPQVQMGLPANVQRVGLSLLGARNADLPLLDLAVRLSMQAGGFDGC
tara:strand:- start:25484 stop:26686 length:1203 start_codon:yes stop_codon:yes gene_type:complete